MPALRSPYINAKADPVTSVLAIQRFADLLRLRAGPQDLPASGAVLVGSIAAAALASMLVIQRVYTPEIAAVRVAVDLLLQLAFVVGALQITGHPERLRQTYSALCGASAVLILLAWPLLSILLDRPEGDQLAAMASLFLLGLYGWAAVVIGHILRHALDTTLGRGVLIGVAYVLTASLLADALVPPTEMP